MIRKPDIVFLDKATVGEVDQIHLLENIGNLEVYQTTQPGERVRHIGSSEIVITNKVIIDREVMDTCPAMKLVCVAATGMNNVDLDCASEKGIIVRNVAGYSTESVVQHTFAMLFHLMNRLDYYNDYVKSGSYAKSGLFTHHGRPFFELAGSTFGIIGLGTIGKRVAEVAQSFGAQVAYYSTTGKNLNNTYKRVSLNELLVSSDIVSVHCPLTKQTKNLLDTNQLRLMKRDAILINTGRGGIVNEAALAASIDNGMLGGAGLDVLAKEPPDADNPLLHVKMKEKLIITPHIAWASIESRGRLVEGIVKNINEYLGKR